MKGLPEFVAAVARVGVAFEGMAEAFRAPARPRGRKPPWWRTRGRDRRPRHPWSTAEDAWLRRDFPRTTTPALAGEMGRTPSSLYQRARKLGLEKDPAFVLETNRKLGAALAATPGAIAKRFQPGRAGGFHTEAQRRAFLKAGKATRFQKGNHFTKTWKPVGTETMTKDGYLVRKVTDVGGYNNEDWKMVHVLTWEKHHGPVPAGHVVVFKDKNRAHIALGNLELITKAENMQRNTIHRYPVELKTTIRALGKLKRTIRRKDEGNQGPT